MAPFDAGHHAAELFAGLWHAHCTPWFLRYIEVAFGVKVSEFPDLEGVIVSEAEDGDVASGMVQNIVLRAWMLDASGFRLLSDESAPPWVEDHNAAEDAGRLYCRWGQFHFFVDGDAVAVRGGFGPNLRGRMVGRVVAVGDEWAFTDVRTPNLPGVMDAVDPRSPVRPELELRGRPFVKTVRFQPGDGWLLWPLPEAECDLEHIIRIYVLVARDAIPTHDRLAACLSRAVRVGAVRPRPDGRYQVSQGWHDLLHQFDRLYEIPEDAGTHLDEFLAARDWPLVAEDFALSAEEYEPAADRVRAYWDGLAAKRG